MKTRHVPTVALFEGGLLSRVRSLLDPQHNRITCMTRRSAWTCAFSFLLCFAALGTIRLGARPNPDASSMPAAAVMLTGAVSTDSNDTSFRPQDEHLGPNERRPNGNCSLSGRVISADSGEPVDHATVYLFSNDTFDAIFIRVASDGSFLFKDIAAGTYGLRTTNTAGYQDVCYNPEGRTVQRPSFTLKDGEQRTNIVLKPSGFVKHRKPLTINNETKEIRLDFSLKPGVTIRGKFVDTAGKEMELDDPAYGLAYRLGYPNPEYQSWSGSANRDTPGQRKHQATFNPGAGDYEEEYMDFPTASTFIVQGMLPGQTVLLFHPQARDLVVQSILYKGQDVTTIGIDTQGDREIQDVTIVIGPPAPPLPSR